MSWKIGVLVFDSRRGLGIFLFTIASRTVLGPTQPPIQRVPGAPSLGVKRPGREADHSPPSSAEVKNAWSYTCTPQYVFMAWCLVKHRDNFTFYLYTFMISLKAKERDVKLYKHSVSGCPLWEDCTLHRFDLDPKWGPATGRSGHIPGRVEELTHTCSHYCGTQTKLNSGNTCHHATESSERWWCFMERDSSVVKSKRTVF
jgi:hypothetical protein